MPIYKIEAHQVASFGDFGFHLRINRVFLDPFSSSFTYDTGRVFLLFACSIFLVPLPVMTAIKKVIF